ncbi:hypothetical protein F5Y18DRAFT_404296 [Xylariaceae sp. FL1019]|nr:hypothetical protein F5Y18DRAFT_404296 [Xylariaceae sp. FL1019]
MSDSSRAGLLALSGSLLGLTSVSVSVRFWVRRQDKLRLEADDYFTVFGLLSFIGACICVFISVHNKTLGYSSHDFTTEQTAAMGKEDHQTQIALDIFTNNTLACVKLSALFFYRRIFCSAGKRVIFSPVTTATIIVVILWLFVFQFLTGFQCGTHFSALWDGTYLEYCTLSFPVLYGLVISDFLLDIWILVIPIPGIMQLNTTIQRKLSIIGVFLLALVGLGASIARMVQYIKIELGGPSFLLYTDHERLVTASFFYTVLEAGVALIAVNLPSLRMFSFSLSALGVLRSVRSLIELAFLQSHSSDIDRDVSEPNHAVSLEKLQKAQSASTRPSGSSNEGVLCAQGGVSSA